MNSNNEKLHRKTSEQLEQIVANQTECFKTVTERLLKMEEENGQILRQIDKNEQLDHAKYKEDIEPKLDELKIVKSLVEKVEKQ